MLSHSFILKANFNKLIMKSQNTVLRRVLSLHKISADDWVTMLLMEARSAFGEDVYYWFPQLFSFCILFSILSRYKNNLVSWLFNFYCLWQSFFKLMGNFETLIMLYFWVNWSHSSRTLTYKYYIFGPLTCVRMYLFLS